MIILLVYHIWYYSFKQEKYKHNKIHRLLIVTWLTTQLIIGKEHDSFWATTITNSEMLREWGIKYRIKFIVNVQMKTILNDFGLVR